jgi:hypothetical protein
MKDQTEGSPLSCEGNPLSVPLPHRLRFLRPPLPALLSATLAGSLPLSGGVQVYHVPLLCPDGLGSACSPVTLFVYERGNWIPLCPSRSLLGPACQHLWLVRLNDVYQQFTCVSHTITPSPLTALVLAVTIFPHGSIAPLPGGGTLSQELPTPRLLQTQVLVGYWR